MADRAEQSPMTELDRGDSRRQALAKIGVGAAVVWAAPLVTTLPGSAVAMGSTPPGTTTTSTAPETTTTSTTTTTTTAPPAEPVLDFNRPISSSGNETLDRDEQMWQPILAGLTGSLVRVAVVVRSEDTVDLVVTVHEVDAEGGLGQAIGSGQIGRVAGSPGSEVVIDLSAPAPVTAGTRYMLVFTRAVPSSPGYWAIHNGPLFEDYEYSVVPGDAASGRTLYVKTYVL